MFRFLPIVSNILQSNLYVFVVMLAGMPGAPGSHG